jgi:acyl-CoA thioesterase FadM
MGGTWELDGPGVDEGERPWPRDGTGTGGDDGPVRIGSVSSEILSRWAVAVEIPIEEVDLGEGAGLGGDVLAEWFARARAAYLERCPSLADGRFESSVRNVEMRQRGPVGHPDTVLVAASVTELGETWFTMRCRVRSLLGTHEVVADGRCTIEVIDPGTGHPLRVPESLRKDLLTLEMGAQFHS